MRLWIKKEDLILFPFKYYVLGFFPSSQLCFFFSLLYLWCFWCTLSQFTLEKARRDSRLLGGSCPSFAMFSVVRWWFCLMCSPEFSADSTRSLWEGESSSGQGRYAWAWAVPHCHTEWRGCHSAPGCQQWQVPAPGGLARNIPRMITQCCKIQPSD